MMILNRMFLYPLQLNDFFYTVYAEHGQNRPGLSPACGSEQIRRYRMATQA